MLEELSVESSLVPVPLLVGSLLLGSLAVESFVEELGSSKLDPVDSLLEEEGAPQAARVNAAATLKSNKPRVCFINFLLVPCYPQSEYKC